MDKDIPSGSDLDIIEHGIEARIDLKGGDYIHLKIPKGIMRYEARHCIEEFERVAKFSHRQWKILQAYRQKLVDALARIVPAPTQSGQEER